MRRGRRLAGSVLVGALALVTWGAASLAAVAADEGVTVTGKVGFGQAAYPYRVYVPASHHPGDHWPLVVMTHGCQTTAEQQQLASGFDAVADREHFVVLYPDVNSIEANTQPGPLNHCWQFPLPTSWFRGGGDPKAIAAMTRAVMTRWHVDRQRVYMVGMSAGGFMTSIMAAAYPDLFAAVAINAGGAYADGLCLGVPAGIPVESSALLARREMGPRARIVPRLAMGGDADQGVPPGCVDKALDQGLRTNNLVQGSSQIAPISLKPAATREVAATEPDHYHSTVTTYRDPAGCVISERWLIHGMNHFWPGGTSDPAYKSFTDPKGPNGAEIAWDFLKRYTKADTSPPCSEAQVDEVSNP
jgi:poly(hydroxyalkanoate) depolymerase family esterase